MKRRFLSSLVLLAAVQALAAAPGVAQEDGPDPAFILRAITESRLDPGRAVPVRSAKLSAGLATIFLDEGILVPAVAEGLGPVELVFLGKGHIEMEAPDQVEAGQLDLFTGAPRLDESFQEAVLVVGSNAEAGALLEQPALQPDAGMREHADAVWGEWRKSREREILHVERSLLLNALGDPLGRGTFGAWLRSDHLGDFVYIVEPDEPEQVRLGQFVPYDLTEKEKRQAEKEIRSEQREGRSLGVEVEDLGILNLWTSASLRSSSGEPAPGAPAFRPKTYTLDVRLAPSGLRLSGKARIDLERMVRGSRVVGLSLPGDFQVERVTDGQGRTLFFRRDKEDLTVILPQAPADGEAVAVVVEYAGNVVVKEWNLTALLQTERWYPRSDRFDRATYDATFHWPKGFDLVASGHRVDGGEEADGTRWERRTLGIPSRGFSFEIGHFDVETARAGHIQVTLAFGSGSNLVGRGSRQEVMRSVLDALTYFEEVFGPYPLDELTVSTVPRGISQGLLGFVTISDGYLAGDRGIWNRYFGVEDRRLVIAHEVSHQWWGGVVGWASYRDQWIGEAMAEYSASLYGRNRLHGELSGVEATTGWQRDLTDPLSIGRSVESLGPVVLGRRLDSSASDDAYRLVVYKKGAVVLNMLAGLVGEEKFPPALRQVLQTLAGKRISTPELVALLEQATGVELDGFAEQLIYGTGLPVVLYSYRWERQGDGWAVRGQLQQMASYSRRYRVVRTDRGVFDVDVKPVPQMDVRKSTLAIPIEVETFDPSEDEGEGRDGANRTVLANLLLKGASSRFSVPVRFEPKGFWLDRESRVFGFFFDESRNPKRALYYRAQDAAARGRLDDAEVLLAKALEMEESAEVVETGRRNVQWEDIQRARRSFNAQVEAYRAVLLMDLGRDDEADAAIGRARRVVKDDLGLDRIQARLEVRRGRYAKAWQLLRRGDRRERLEAQDYALLAIAARETGHPEEAAEALKKARERGVDVTVLTAAP